MKTYNLYKTVACSLSLLLVNSNAFSQAFDGVENEKATEVIENSVENENQVTDFVEITEQLEHFQQYKLDINTATKEDFEKLALLTNFQITNILRYRSEKIRFLSIYELKAVDGMGTEDVLLLAPFIRTENDLSIEKLPENKGELQIYTALPMAPTDSDAYLGNAMKSRLRLKKELTNQLLVGLSAEKDAGEPWLSSQRKLPDYYSGYVKYGGNGIVKTAVIGDFQANFGQGLVLWSGFSPGINSSFASMEKRSNTFRQHSSCNENRYFRGVASSFGYRNITFSAFVSKKYIDANIKTSATDEDRQFVTSLQTSGLHNTLHALSNKQSLGENIAGCNVLQRNGRFTYGLTATTTRYSVPLIPSDELYNFYSFRGNVINNTGIHYRYEGRKLVVFGESAICSNKGRASINGMLIELAPDLSFAALIRYFEPSYAAPYANVFAVSANASNEKGLFMGVAYNLFKNLTVSGYADAYQSIWLKYKTVTPPYGRKYYAQALYSYDANFSIYFRYTRNLAESDSLNAYPAPYFQYMKAIDKVRLQTTYCLKGGFALKSRIEQSMVTIASKRTTKGLFVNQDATWKSSNGNIAMSVRYGIFNSPAWDNRFYLFDPGIAYVYSVPVLYGTGSYTSVSIRLRCFRYVHIALRYSYLQANNNNATNPKANGEVQVIYRK